MQTNKGMTIMADANKQPQFDFNSMSETDIAELIKNAQAAQNAKSQAELDGLDETVRTLVKRLGKDKVYEAVKHHFPAVAPRKSGGGSKPASAGNGRGAASVAFTDAEKEEYRSKYPVGSTIQVPDLKKGDGKLKQYIVSPARTADDIIHAFRNDKIEIISRADGAPV